MLAAIARKPGWAGLLLGLAIANKAWAVLAIGPVLIALPAGRWRALAIAGGLAFLFTLPFLLAGPVAATPHGASASGSIFHPWQVWWFFGDMDLPVPGPDARIARSAPAWLSPIPHPLIVLLALPLSLLAARRKADPLALLALLLLLRCVLDPWNNTYYMLPCVLALAAWEPLRYGRPPLFALATVVATFISMERIFEVAPLDVVSLSYLVWALPLAALPRLAALRAGAGGDADAQLGRPGERLKHDAVALGEADERGEILLAGVRVEVEAQADRAKAHGRVAVDAERAAEVEVALGVDPAASHVDADRRRDRAQRHAGARGERLEQHVARAQLGAVAAARGVEARLRQRPSRVDRARDALAEAAARLQGHDGGIGIVAVALLERRLECAQGGGVHAR